MKKLIAIALFGGAAALSACGTNNPTTTSQAERDRDASRGASTAPANPATANQGGQAGTQAPATSAAGSPGTQGTMGNPGPGGQPHSGSGSAK